jgi:puromycin-sensitive aminopeptidase
MHSGSDSLSSGQTVNPYRLPRTVTPSRYDLAMSPDLRGRTFVGRVTTAVTVHEPISQIVCNASELTVHQAWVVDASGAKTMATGIAHDAETERVTLTMERTILVGAAKIVFEFEGALNDKLAGFYASTYTADDGVVHTIAATQFESTDARKAFPCWDEPDLKAVFSVTMIVDSGLTAISNEPVHSESVMASGKRSVTFEDTMIMSTYLLCFIVGELEATEAVDVDGTPLRVVYRPGMAHLTAFALEIGAFSLKYFQDYYGIKYPGRKMDLIALPDFAAGAMENVGAVTFREVLLLVDPEKASHQELERIADVVAHEIAHMWFGDLVTMSWWNGLWLNEAFATYAEIACVNAFRPEWDRWTSFGVSRTAAMQVDALHATRPIEFPVVSPSDADGMFDVLTYEKGASILRQLEQYLGEDKFRDGVRHYLSKHAYGNSETTDLFDSLQEVSGEPVAEMMNGWVFTGGFPLVSVTSTAEGVSIQQTPFTYRPNGPKSTWLVPVMWRTVSTDGKSIETGRVLLRTDPVVISTRDAAVVINAGGHGFFRVHYDDASSARILAVLTSLPPIERYQIFADTWAAVLAGSAPTTAFTTLAETLSAERDPNVWSAAFSAFDSLDQIATDTQRQTLRAQIQRVATPALDDLGWEATAGESSQRIQVRGMLISLLGVVGADAPTRAKCATLVESAIAGGLSPDVATSVITVAAREGDNELWDRYNALRSVGDPTEAIRYLRAMSSFEDPSLRQRTLDLAFSGEVRSQDSPFMIVRMCADRINGTYGWAALRDHWDTYSATLPGNLVGRMIDGLIQRTEPGLSAEIKAFFATHPVPQSTKQIEQKLELLSIYQQLRDSNTTGTQTVAMPTKTS